MTENGEVCKFSEMSASRISLLGEFELKKFEAEQRMGEVFSVFVKLEPGNGYFICGGNAQFYRFSNQNFACVVTGASLSEINQGMELLQKVGSRISSVFSSDDFHSTVAMDYLSKYLRTDIRNMKKPQALAVEFFITDILGSLIRVSFQGDIEVDSIDNADNKILLLGGYDKKFREDFWEEIKQVPQSIDKEKMTEFAERLKDKLKLSKIGFVIP